jgi:hypothetical protein
MISAKKISQIIALAAFFGVALYAVVYLMASHSAAFEFIEQKIKNSQAIKTQVGDIKEIRPSLLGSYDQKTVGSDEWVSMTINAAQETGSDTILATYAMLFDIQPTS